MIKLKSEQMTNNKSTSLADKLFPDNNVEDIDILNIPPADRRLRTETYDFTVSTLIEYLNQNHISIPNFQRGYVWNKTQASRLIESLIINCPIPVIYLSQNNDETLSVIDGNQRVNSIKLFLNDEFDLKGLSAYPELEGLLFSELDPRFQRHILNRTLRCICILKDTHPQIKFDVFERLNTGSVKLSAHELRHGLYMGPLMRKIEELASNAVFKKLTMNEKDKRMKADELIVRYFAFSTGWRDYSKPLDDFLNKYCEHNKNLDNSTLTVLETGFLKTLNTINTVLGNKSFRTFDQARKSPKFNAALFDAQMVAFAEMNLRPEQIDKLLQEGFPELNYNFISSEDFVKFISSGTTAKNSVIGRISAYCKFVESVLQK